MCLANTSVLGMDEYIPFLPEIAGIRENESS